MLLTFIKLPFVIKIFVLSIFYRFTQVLMCLLHLLHIVKYAQTTFIMDAKGAV